MKRILTAFVLLTGVSAQAAHLRDEHHLRLVNDFKAPEEVVAYYVGRDSEGFVWSGFDKTERSAFTVWESSPASESFLVAKKFDIQPVRWTSGDRNEAVVQVEYDVLGSADAFGTLVPWRQPREHRVSFVVRKVGEQWKIAEPGPSITPVLLQKQLQYN
jgi:hypothetical protein